MWLFILESFVKCDKDERKFLHLCLLFQFVFRRMTQLHIQGHSLLWDMSKFFNVSHFYSKLFLPQLVGQ